MAPAALALVTDPPGLTGRIAYSQQLLWELGLGPQPLDELSWPSTPASAVRSSRSDADSDRHRRRR